MAAQCNGWCVIFLPLFLTLFIPAVLTIRMWSKNRHITIDLLNFWKTYPIEICNSFIDNEAWNICTLLNCNEQINTVFFYVSGLFYYTPVQKLSKN